MNSSSTSRTSRWLFQGLLAAATVAGCTLSDLTENMFTEEPLPSGDGGGTTTSSTTTTSTTTTTTSGGGAGGSGPAVPPLDCGDKLECPLEGDGACCWRSGQGSGVCIDGPANPATCNTSPGPSNRRTRIECQVPEHCPTGSVCCGTLQGNYYTQTVCTAQCADPAITLCDPVAPNCPASAPDCVSSSLLPPGYYVCRP
ncbi:hypothetical protein [Chondromyces crocatus]|uniref:Secreted protein n=1 Tax=Chondromyces crocatus TaxID=52 RepID=A0A0K1EEH7_CHOCO|nr:hypothetical protein [Chondromyces crocatus]AKT39077.1 uncharacterized protein CMC5_032240 [Chondromyces crocatus]